MIDAVKFKIWLQQNGAEILPPTNEYELVRFKGKEKGVIYTSGKTSSSYANQAILCFLQGKKWDGFPISTGRKTTYNKYKLPLIKRDGKDCFYCSESLEEDITVEHLIPLTAGGKNLLSNMVLAHKECNNKQGNKSLAEKVTYAINCRVHKIAKRMMKKIEDEKLSQTQQPVGENQLELPLQEGQNEEPSS